MVVITTKCHEVELHTFLQFHKYAYGIEYTMEGIQFSIGEIDWDPDIDAKHMTSMVKGVKAFIRILEGGESE
jgi:hypothetical protein